MFVHALTVTLTGPAHYHVCNARHVRVFVHALTVTLTGPAHYHANFLFISDLHGFCTGFLAVLFPFWFLFWVSMVLLASKFSKILNCFLIQIFFKFQNLFIYKICLNSTFCSHTKNVQMQKNVQIRFLFICVTC
jgi:hypothetical protein